MSPKERSKFHQSFCNLVLACWITVLLPLTGNAEPRSDLWELDLAHSELSLRVFKAGLFSGFLHDHLFVPQSWKVTAQFNPSHHEAFHVDVLIAASSLRDMEPKLSAEDRAKVDQQVISPDVLDAKRFPEISFSADRFVVSAQHGEELQGTADGKLSLHGVTRSLQVPVRVWERGNEQVVLGKVSFKQSDFGIAPLHKAGGSIAVEDQVLVDFSLRLRPSNQK
jgi:polyisoprenoid-binding protein YceI